MSDYAEHTDKIKQLHRMYYHARLQHNLDLAVIYASKLVTEATQLLQVSVQDALEKRDDGR